MSKQPDVVVVGAGIAGLAAARELERQGLTCLIIEAKPRIGGRALTDEGALGVPFDLGCAWLHSASRNPWVGIAGELGLALETERVPRAVALAGRLLEARRVAAWERYARQQFERIAAAGEHADAAAADHIEPHAEWAVHFRGWFEMVNGVAPEESSAADHARYEDTGENHRIATGFGSLVRAHFARMRVQLGEPVEAIGWGRRPTVRSGGRVRRPGAVIVTVSTGVLARRRIRFEPPLPDWKRAGISALPMGHAERIGVRLPAPACARLDSQLAGRALLSRIGEEVMSLQLCPFGYPLAVAYLGGETARRSALESHRQLCRRVGAHLAPWVGSIGSEQVIRSRWSADPEVQGAYSAARPGGAAMRERLAAPLPGLLFAGEATSPTRFSTAHGALESGQRAAAEAAALLTRGR